MLFDLETGCRIALGLIFVGVVAVGLPFRIRADRAGGRVSPRVDPGWFWAMMIIVAPVVLLSSLAFLFRPRSMDFVTLNLPAGLRLTGSLFGLMGLWLFGWMFLHLGLNVTSTSMPRDNAKLVTTGPYRWIRHPMYSAALILVVATTLLTANAVVLVGGIFMFVLLVARSQIEERRLVEKFGEGYRAYQRNTGRFVPRFRRGAM